MDYSFKAVKTVLPFERQTLKNAQQALTVPVQYGAMPDLGRYSRPDGPIANWSELLPLGRIAEARAAQEEAAQMAAHDIAFVAEGVWEAGADAIDLDTSGAAGDADLLAALTPPGRSATAAPTWASRWAWRARWSSACTASWSGRACGSPASGRTSR